MRISIAQINSTIGDFSGNREKILGFTKKALEEHSDLILFPELAVCGYPPMDLLDQDSFVEMNIRSIHILQRELPPGIAVGIGYVNRNPYAGGKSLVNEYGVLLDGKIAFSQLKTLLPTYDVFDEARNFEPCREWSAFEYKGERIGIAICEDVWRETSIPGTHYIRDPVGELLDQGISLLCVPSASPYMAGKLKVRQALAERIAIRGNIPFVYINSVGANDSILFDGRSFIIAPTKDASRDASRRNYPVQVLAKGFEEDLVSWETGTSLQNQMPDLTGDDPFKVGLTRYELDMLEEALVMGIRDYMDKCGFKRAHLGLSGGIDSALVAYLGVRAAGKDNIACFSMPSRYSSQGSKDDAKELAENLGCRYEVLPIETVFTSFLGTLEGVFEKRPFDIAEENLQARIRGTLMMAFSNKFDSMLLTTGNKSELAMGYCTLYGDTNGSVGPIGDLFKTEVFALCKRINERSLEAGGKPIIPEAIIDKPPSAELRPNQKDQDSLPPYEVLDEILKLYLFQNLSKDEIVKRGWDEELAGRIIGAVAKAEFKRRQAPPVLKVSPRAFGMGRRMPIARRVYEIGEGN
ncbi:NAD(+) synthase (glutamine-hydrolyzing) [Treponema primitia ZAS-2]|uniref:Glutamine-dependent NAD(+) synthetase n=1 Tax=Treponema primitia (strain ATCC BAA-887 / DSM 12427 / ZAS-2) TaxID=545694 RepID=F5YQU1_TREPZ|nr:NAD+ synthase [Treponema primitia]AEF84845.1 NAD(+) synthase (glutamine-hydrolyzing) [Treponema primitia ZAS-2]